MRQFDEIRLAVDAVSKIANLTANGNVEIDRERLKIITIESDSMGFEFHVNRIYLDLNSSFLEDIHLTGPQSVLLLKFALHKVTNIHYLCIRPFLTFLLAIIAATVE